MTAQDSHSTSSSGTFDSQKLVLTFSPYVLIFVFIYLSSKIGKAFNYIFFKSSILVQIALYFSNSFSSSLQKDINLLSSSLNLNILTYPLILGIIKTNGLIALSNFIPIKYLELDFLSINFEATILSKLASQIFIGFFGA